MKRRSFLKLFAAAPAVAAVPALASKEPERLVWKVANTNSAPKCYRATYTDQYGETKQETLTVGDLPQHTHGVVVRCASTIGERMRETRERYAFGVLSKH